MMQLLDIDIGSLPIIWDAVPVWTGDLSGEDITYVLCEINVSSVLPFRSKRRQRSRDRTAGLQSQEDAHHDERKHQCPMTAMIGACRFERHKDLACRACLWPAFAGGRKHASGNPWPLCFLGPAGAVTMSRESMSGAAMDSCEADRMGLSNKRDPVASAPSSAGHAARPPAAHDGAWDSARRNRDSDAFVPQTFIAQLATLAQLPQSTVQSYTAQPTSNASTRRQATL